MLLRELTASQWNDWLAYFAIEPFGPSFDDLRHGELMAAYYNAHRDTKMHPEPYSAEEFLHTLREPEPEQTPEERSTAIKALFRSPHG